MRTKTTALLIGLGVLAGAPVMLPVAEARDDAREARQDSNQTLRDAIQKLQHARYDLAMADRKFATERGDSLQQTQYAIEQLFAAVNDERWQQEDRDLWQKQQKEADDAVRERRNVDRRSDAEFPRAESALKNLRDARRLVDKVEGAGYEGHKSKALVHIDEAIKAMEKGIDKARGRD